MGTYTTNYNLFMPSIGEQGWGDLVNANFSTIDIVMEGLDTRVGTLETEMNAVEERVTTLEAGEFNSADIGTLKFGSIVMPTLSYEGYYDITYAATGSGSVEFPMSHTVPIFSTPFPISGVVSIKSTLTNGKLISIGSGGKEQFNVTRTQTEYTISDALIIYYFNSVTKGTTDTVTIGIPKFIQS